VGARGTHFAQAPNPVILILLHHLRLDLLLSNALASCHPCAPQHLVSII
jgi:hypothetical protein